MLKTVISAYLESIYGEDVSAIFSNTFIDTPIFKEERYTTLNYVHQGIKDILKSGILSHETIIKVLDYHKALSTYLESFDVPTKSERLHFTPKNSVNAILFENIIDESWFFIDEILYTNTNPCYVFEEENIDALEAELNKLCAEHNIEGYFESN